MGVLDRSIVDFIDKIKNWIFWGGKKSSGYSKESEMSCDSYKMCCECKSNFTDLCIRYHCQGCGRLLCGKCLSGYDSPSIIGSSGLKNPGKGEKSIRSCKSCRYEGDRKFSGKVYPSLPLRDSPEPPSPTSLVGRIDGIMNIEKIKRECFPGFLEAHEHCYSPHSASCSSLTSFSGHPSPVACRGSYYRPHIRHINTRLLVDCRSDEEDTDSAGQFFSPSSEYCQDDVSDTDTISINARHDFYSFQSVESSPSDSPLRNKFASNIVGHSVQLEQGESPRFHNDALFDHEIRAILKRPEIMINDTETTNYCTDETSKIGDQKHEKPLDFENNGRIWFPPPPEDENDDIEDNLFGYDDEDDDVGEAGAVFSSFSSLPSQFPAKEKHEEYKEPLRAVVRSHFRALVSQLLKGEGIKVGDENDVDGWLDIVSTLSWQAASSVKPDTSRGGSMDPSDYVKVKCVATGNPNESIYIKGVVCTKNIRHKRMTSQYKNPRLLLLGGALEYQRVPNQLSSFNTLLQQENDHLKMIISKIEAHRPNVLLVEKSVSSYAQEHLLAKEISLVLNVKRPLLERIARCTGAHITPTIDSISTTRLGHCELFRLERVSEELETANQFNKKPSKTLMFFEGCPRRLGCTVLLKGTNRQELKKLKHVVQYAVFAAYHLSLETSFLADEGASLPKTSLKPSVAIPEKETDDFTNSTIHSPDASPVCHAVVEFPAQTGSDGEAGCEEVASEAVNSSLDEVTEDSTSRPSVEVASFDITDGTFTEYGVPQGQCKKQDMELALTENITDKESSSEYFTAADSHQSILVSFSSRCVLNGTLCERSRLLRIKFYGCFDKPLGRYLHDGLFDQKAHCQSCNELAEEHLQCFTHQQGSLTISVKRLPNVKLPGERDGKIWMWHRCLRCALIDGIPPATRRVVMSDAAWGLSFGKFLELSFSNHATANRVATCGHSLQRDCLRFYGFGCMVAFFHYTPIDILSVRLPPSMIEFNTVQQDWIIKEAQEIFTKMETLYKEISIVLNSIVQRSTSLGYNELHDHVLELNNLVEKERTDFTGLLQQTIIDQPLPGQRGVDILEINRLRRSLVIGSHVWDRRLYSLDSLLRTRGSNCKEIQRNASAEFELKRWRTDLLSKDAELNYSHDDPLESTNLQESDLQFVENGVPGDSSLLCLNTEEEWPSDERLVKKTCRESTSPASSLSDKIDSAWTGTGQLCVKSQAGHSLQTNGPTASMVKQLSQIDNPPVNKVKSPLRVYSFDSAVRVQDRIQKGIPSSSRHLLPLRSFHASGEYRNMVRDPLSNVLRTYSKLSPKETNVISSTPSLISSLSRMADGAHLLLPQTGDNNIVIAVYDNEPTSVISYALSSKEYENLIADNSSEKFLVYGSEDASSSMGSRYMGTKKSPHLRIIFGDESLSSGGKVKFSVTCYFAKQFDILRKKCCPTEVDFLRSLSRCKAWSAQGGKSNVYFAKSLDERFIIKQVTKTELDSFEEFAPEYFKYLTDSLSSGSPTCLAKILGIYQISVKHIKGGKETKMELMVMENLFYKRNVSRVYDLKGSARSRYNPDTKGANTVLLDMNLLETLHTKPIFLGSKAKRSLERAVWNDTSFLASVDVMDYSLLVGVDEERKELVLGIIDIMRQYTWDKHLETWVKASGILGGPKNTAPTIISPKQYKKRFRKAMTTYFLTVPDQWSS